MEKKPLTCRVAGHDIAYHCDGEGEAVLLVHGITTYSFIWRRIVPLLKDHYRVIRVDLLGCGTSEKPLKASYSIRQHASLLREFADTLELGAFHFVGHDVGGGIGQIFAVRYPDAITDLTLINSVGHDFWPVQPIIAMRTPIIRQLAMATLDIGALRLVVRRGLYHKNRLDQDLIDRFWAPMRTRLGRKAFMHFADSLNNRHLIEIEGDLKKLCLPVLIIRGDADLCLSGAIAEKLHRDIPDSRLCRIATGSHFIQEDEPEMLAEEMMRFWHSLDHSSPRKVANADG
jgi:pimeloyl-ACP methyl ester carboxylesterase